MAIKKKHSLSPQNIEAERAGIIWHENNYTRFFLWENAQVYSGDKTTVMSIWRLREIANIRTSV